VGGVRLDEVVGVDVLDGARSRGRHSAVVLPFAAAFLRKEDVRRALLRLPFAFLRKEDVRRALLRLRGARVWGRRASGVAAEVTYTGVCGLWAV
jgi:hypothetical protein